MKRMFDFVLTALLFVLLAPLLAVTAVTIRICLGSPILFRQKRPGLRARPFFLLKFRTMTDARDEHGNLLPDELRLTHVGAFLRRCSLDELPQLINVLKGEMSLIGPRPLLMEYLPLYTSQQARRHEIKPGITGWAQVHGRNAVTWEDRFNMDIWYVDHRSFRLDLKILWLTFLKVLRREGISERGQATMTKFSGSANHGAGK